MRHGIPKLAGIALLTLVLAACEDDAPPPVEPVDSSIGQTMTVVKQVQASLEDDLRMLAVADKVYQLELISTGVESATNIKLADDTEISLGPEAELLLDDFVYSGGAGDSSVIELTKGTARFITGKMKKEKIKIRTPSATIGIRGTNFLVHVADDGETEVLVDKEGIVEVQGLCAGLVGTEYSECRQPRVISVGQTVTVPTAAPPRLSEDARRVVAMMDDGVEVDLCEPEYADVRAIITRRQRLSAALEEDDLPEIPEECAPVIEEETPQPPDDPIDTPPEPEPEPETEVIPEPGPQQLSQDEPDPEPEPEQPRDGPTPIDPPEILEAPEPILPEVELPPPLEQEPEVVDVPELNDPPELRIEPQGSFPQADSEQIGQVRRIVGQASSTRTGQAAQGAPVFVDEGFSPNSKSAVSIGMQSGGIVQVGPETYLFLASRDRVQRVGMGPGVSRYTAGKNPILVSTQGVETLLSTGSMAVVMDLKGQTHVLFERRAEGRVRGPCIRSSSTATQDCPPALSHQDATAITVTNTGRAVPNRFLMQYQRFGIQSPPQTTQEREAISIYQRVLELRRLLEGVSQPTLQPPIREIEQNPAPIHEEPRFDEEDAVKVIQGLFGLIGGTNNDSGTRRPGTQTAPSPQPDQPTQIEPQPQQPVLQNQPQILDTNPQFQIYDPQQQQQTAPK